MRLKNPPRPIEEFHRMVAEKNGQKQSGNKFHAVPQVVDGVRHDSTVEADAIKQLHRLQSGGYIRDLKTDKRELRYAIKWGDVWICSYTGDASFVVVKDFEIETFEGTRTLRVGEFHLADKKSAPTRKKRDYILVRSLMLACHGIRILEL